MKKLIAISVVFALVAGVAFAVDLGASVSGLVDVFTGNSKGGGVLATTGEDGNGNMIGVRIEGAGEAGEGKFGGKVRFDFAGGVKGQGYAWWKPIDQFKLIIGQSNASDGFWGKEGNSGWSFNQVANDTLPGATTKGNIWGGSYAGWPTRYRAAFADAADSSNVGLYMEIRPMDMLGINIGFTGFSYDVWDPTAGEDKDGDGIPDGAMVPANKWDKKHFTEKFVFQADLNLAFGNIALTYKGDSMFLYYGGSFGDMNLDVGLSIPGLTNASNLQYIFFGAAVKYSAGAFGVKVRTVEGIPVKGNPFTMIFGVLPSFAINDNITAFLYGEMGMSIKNGLGDLGWTIYPYLRIGAEWGPSFYAGFQIEQAARGVGVTYRLPIYITVGF